VAIFTPAENLVRNVEAFMTWRGLNQGAVADAMATLGFTWYRKTVHRVLGGERPIRVDELYGLAVVFETTVGALLSPDIAAGVTAETMANGYRIGKMAPIHSISFLKLLEVPDDRLERAEIGVRSWSPDDFVDDVPQWKPWPFASPDNQLTVMLRASGWDTLDDFLAAHPAGHDVFDGLLSFVADHPNTGNEAPME
jgi:hypothetical protein